MCFDQMKMKLYRMKTHIIFFLVLFLIQYLVANDNLEYPKFYGISQLEEIEIFVKIQSCLIWRKTGEVSSYKSWNWGPVEFEHMDDIYQNKYTGHWHAQALINPDIDTEKCEIGQDENHTEYRMSQKLTDLHHPHNLARPKEELWIDLNNLSDQNFKIFSFNFDKKTGFSQSISGYEVFGQHLSEFKGKCILENHKIF